MRAAPVSQRKEGPGFVCSVCRQWVSEQGKASLCGCCSLPLLLRALGSRLVGGSGMGHQDCHGHAPPVRGPWFPGGLSPPWHSSYSRAVSARTACTSSLPAWCFWGPSPPELRPGSPRGTYALTLDSLPAPYSLHNRKVGSSWVFPRAWMVQSWVLWRGPRLWP